VEYHSKMRELAGKNLNVGWIFKPVSLGINRDRSEGQRTLFESSILKPLVEQTRNKMINREPKMDGESLARYQRALTALIRLEADQHSAGGILSGTNAASDYLQSFLAYLADTDMESLDTNLVSVMQWTYSTEGSGKGKWPPSRLLGGDSLLDNTAIRVGLENYREASVVSQGRIEVEVNQLDKLADALTNYASAELQWLKRTNDSCSALESGLRPVWTRVSNAWALVSSSTDGLEDPVTNLTSEYLDLERQARGASEDMFRDIAAGLPDTERTSGLFAEIDRTLRDFQAASVEKVSGSLSVRSSQLQELDQDYVSPSSGSFSPQFQRRWSLYEGACDLARASFAIQDSDVGSQWDRYKTLESTADKFREELVSYQGAFARSVTNICVRIAGQAEVQLRLRYVADYVAYVSSRLDTLPSRNLRELTNSVAFIDRAGVDLAAYQGGQAAQLTALRNSLDSARTNVVNQYAGEWANRLLSGLGFPVFLSSSGKQMKMEDVLAFKRDARVFKQELLDPVWAKLPRTSLLNRLANAPSFDVVDALVTEDGSVDALELWFVPPASDDQQGRNMLSVFRVAEVEFRGSPSGWKDLTRATAPFLFNEGSLNSGLSLRFRKLESDTSSEQVPVQNASWGLIRLIEEGRAERDPSGTVWRLRIPLEDKDQGLSGDALFEARLKRPLPKVTDWPRK